MVERLGKLSGQIVNVFNEVDPFHCFYGENVDEYVGYIERFFSQLGERDFSALTDEEIKDLVRGSFHASQIEQRFVEQADLDELAKKIILVREYGI